MCFSHSQNTHTHKYYIYPSATKRTSHLIHVLPKYLDVNTYLLKYLDEHMNAYWVYLPRSASNGLHVFRMEYIRHRTLLLPTQSTFCAVAFLVLHAACGKTNLTIEKYYGLIPHYNKHSGISGYRRLVTYMLTSHPLLRRVARAATGRTCFPTAYIPTGMQLFDILYSKDNLCYCLIYPASAHAFPPLCLPCGLGMNPRPSTSDSLQRTCTHANQRNVVQFLLKALSIRSISCHPLVSLET